MSKGVLIHRAADVYSPFDAREAKCLREYVEAVDSFVATDALKQSWKWKIERVDVETSRCEEYLEYAGEEALFDMAGRFRLLYVSKHRMSFDAIRKLLHEHVEARESPLRAEALAELRILRGMKKTALSNPWNIRIGGERLSSEGIIDMHLNGRYLHRDDDKVEMLESASVIIRSEFLAVVKGLAHVFTVGRAVVEPVLREPSLLPV